MKKCIFNPNLAVPTAAIEINNAYTKRIGEAAWLKTATHHINKLLIIHIHSIKSKSKTEIYFSQLYKNKLKMKNNMIRLISHSE